MIGNLLNAANAVGVDPCYIWRARKAFDTEEGKRPPVPRNVRRV